MKKVILYFLTSITAIWFIDVLLSGFAFAGGPITIFLVDLFIIVGIYLTEWVASKARGTSMLLFFIIGLCVNFFSLYFATLFLENFSVSSGSLKFLNVGFLKQMDQILSLLLGALVAVVIAAITRWAAFSSRTE